jgi:hypothetical protein
VGLNNLKAGFDALKRLPAAISCFRDKINTDLAAAVEAIYASLTVKEGTRGQRGEQSEAAPVK